MCTLLNYTKHRLTRIFDMCFKNLWQNSLPVFSIFSPNTSIYCLLRYETSVFYLICTFEHFFSIYIEFRQSQCMITTFGSLAVTCIKYLKFKLPEINWNNFILVFFYLPDFFFQLFILPLICIDTTDRVFKHTHWKELPEGKFY